MAWSRSSATCERCGEISRNQEPSTSSSAVATTPATHRCVVVISALLPVVAVRQRLGGEGCGGRELHDGLGSDLLLRRGAEVGVAHAGLPAERVEPRRDITVAAGVPL